MLCVYFCELLISSDYIMLSIFTTTYSCQTGAFLHCTSKLQKVPVLCLSFQNYTEIMKVHIYNDNLVNVYTH